MSAAAGPGPAIRWRWRRPRDLCPARVIDQVTACASPQGGYHGRVIRVCGQHDDLGIWHALTQQAGGLDAITAGHPQIHEDDVGEQVSGHGDGLVAITGGAHDFDVGQEAQQHRQSFTDHSLVVSDESTHRVPAAAERYRDHHDEQVRSKAAQPPEGRLLPRPRPAQRG